MNDNECAIERFEKLAAAFREKYGYRAPGKDGYEDRPVDDKTLHRQWQEFLAEQSSEGGIK